MRKINNIKTSLHLCNVNYIHSKSYKNICTMFSSLHHFYYENEKDRKAPQTKKKIGHFRA